jgi:iron(III) transport system substrate-binding protein
MYRIRKLLAAVTVLAAGGAGLSACANGGGNGGDGAAAPTGSASAAIPGVSTALVNAACKDGTVQVWQMPLTPAVTDVNNAFMAAYPCVHVSSLTGVGGTILARYNSAVNTGTAPDVLELSIAGAMETLAKQGSFKKFTPAETTVASSDAGYTVYDYGLQVGAMYNSNSVSAQLVGKLSNWCAIADPAFANLKFGLVSPADGGTTETAWAYIFKDCGGASFIDKFIKTHKVTKFASAEPAAAAVTSGQLDMVLPDSANASLPLWKTGAPVRFAIPSPVVETHNTLAIPKTAAHPSAAELYIDFILSAAGEKIYNDDDFTTPGNTAVTATNPVVKQSWWHVPSQTYSYDPVAISSQAAMLAKVFDGA